VAIKTKVADTAESGEIGVVLAIRLLNFFLTVKA